MTTPQLPKIACICCTFLRPQLLAEAVDGYLRQDYPVDRRELIIVDDAGQYEATAADALAEHNVRLVSFPHRIRTLGEKRNLTAALASPDVDAYAVWDDDDVYLPWHLSQLAAALLAGAQWVRPARVWLDKRQRLELKAAGGLFHGAWAFTREAFAAVGGYPFMQSGQDQALARRFDQRRLVSHCQLAAAEAAGLTAWPGYVYRWFTTPAAWHLSAGISYEQLGVKAAAELAGQPRVARIEPARSRDWPRLVEQAVARHQTQRS